MFWNKKHQRQHLTLSQKQVLAAKCLSAFCQHENISHIYIEQFMAYLYAIDVENLPQWEQEGGELKLNGRGDLLPDEISQLLNARNKPSFVNLLNAVAEVGLADMYGATTNSADLYLEKCFKILKEHSVAIPLIAA